MKEMHEGEERGGIIMVCSIARATLIPKPSHLFVHTARTNNVNVECCGMYSSPNRKCACFRTGIGSGRGFISGCFRNSAGEAYRLRYTYFSNLVARTRLPVLRKMSGYRG